MTYKEKKQQRDEKILLEYHEMCNRGEKYVDQKLAEKYSLHPKSILRCCRDAAHRTGYELKTVRTLIPRV